MMSTKFSKNQVILQIARKSVAMMSNLLGDLIPRTKSEPTCKKKTQ